MLSMNRMRCGSFCMMRELVRVPSPKNRTPRISVPSVTPVAAKMMRASGREILGAIDLLEVRDSHRATAIFILGLVHDQSSEDLAVQTPHRRGRQDPFRRAAGAHDRVDSRADDRRRDAGRQVAVADQANAGPGGADLVDQLLMARPVEHRDDEIDHAAAETAGNRLEILVHRRIEAHVILRARSDDQLLHVEIGRVQQSSLGRGGEHRDGVRRAGRAEIRALERIDGDIHLRVGRRSTRPPATNAPGRPSHRCTASALRRARLRR